ncbi:hypothetical protein CHS0354_005509 [Potamilus streckersoni]|uniref:DUF19 domain-containing protein n=1 Tax=Potamilus streckersoni TaxID=2493646 RepID=A0AAE0SUH5_9BIVA|nr:hypothetical protein CHS0354_005509 [Potamilus streckersoni]
MKMVFIFWSCIFLCGLQMILIWAIDCNDGYYKEWMSCLKNYTVSVSKIMENNSSIKYQPLRLFSEICQRIDVRMSLTCFASGIHVCYDKVKELNIPPQALKEMEGYSRINLNSRCFQLKILAHEWPCLSSYNFKPYFVCMAKAINNSMDFCSYYMAQVDCIQTTVGSICGEKAADAYNMWSYSDMDVRDCQINPSNSTEIPNYNMDLIILLQCFVCIWMLGHK